MCRSGPARPRLRLFGSPQYHISAPGGSSLLSHFPARRGIFVPNPLASRLALPPEGRRDRAGALDSGNCSAITGGPHDSAGDHSASVTLGTRSPVRPGFIVVVLLSCGLWSLGFRSCRIRPCRCDGSAAWARFFGHGEFDSAVLGLPTWRLSTKERHFPGLCA